MAYTNVQSGEIADGAQYYSGKLPLGDYNFYLQYDATTAKVVTRCDLPSGLRAATQRQLPAGAQLQQWRIEANETEASVYAQVRSVPLDTGDVPVPVSAASTIIEHYVYGPNTLIGTWTIEGVGVSQITGENSKRQLLASEHANATWSWIDTDGTEGHGSLTNTFTYRGKTVYYSLTGQSGFGPMISVSPSTTGDLAKYAAAVAWTMIYGVPDPAGEDEILVARFAINIGDAGGYPGGGGGWISPGDWNPDPTTTLHLTVNGALSGRHNDALNDTSYSYVPADNTAVAGYGCGGGGGHGGGGGGGASTVIAEQFATNKANSKVIVVTVKRHGYGSGGSKGAKGGDGCILIYY